jgi:hypothetical protein
VILSEVLEDCCCKECAESKDFNDLDVVEDLLQGVHARSSQKDLKCENKLKRSRPSNSSRDCTKRLCIGVFEPVLKTHVQVSKSSWGSIGFISQRLTWERVDGRNPLRKIL